MKDRSKKRSKSQLFGEEGEAVFRTWAVRHRLSPTKPESDYGIDYVCTTFQPDAFGGELISGPLVAVQVRSTRAKPGKQRITMNREDAETALRIDGPFLLAGIDLSKDRVYFRFVDEAFMAELKGFLAGGNESISWPLTAFKSSDADFYLRLENICNPGYQHHLRWVRAKLDIAAVSPGSKVRFAHNDEGGIAVVKLPLITAAFKVVESMQQAAAHIVFEEGRIPDDPEKFPLHPSILSLARLARGPVVIEGAVQREVELTIAPADGAEITIPVAVRSIGDEVGFVLQSGLYLTFSAARKKGDEFIHEFDHGVTASGALGLDGLPAEFEFLKRLRKGATIRSHGGRSIPIDLWGNLQYLGQDLERAESALRHLALPWGKMKLADVVKEPVLRATGVLAAFLEKIEISRVLPGFVYEASVAAQELKEEWWRPCRFNVPVVMNLNDRGVVLWSRGLGSVYFEGDMICGFRAEKLDEWSAETREPFPDLAAPEMWLYKDWPGVPLGVSGAVAVSKKYHELPLSGSVEVLS